MIVVPTNARVAKAALTMGLEYVVITSVTRDDLPDGGAEQFCQVVEEIRKILTKVEEELEQKSLDELKGILTMMRTKLSEIIKNN